MDEMDQVVATLAGVVPKMLVALREANVLDDLARFNAEYRDRLMEHGFTREEAVEIVIRSKLLPESK